jgi:hypothetical protein
MDAAVAFTDEKTGVFEHAHVLRDRRQGHLERFGELADRAFAAGELRQHRAARGIGQRGECRVEGWIVNQRVNYYVWTGCLSTWSRPATLRNWSADCEYAKP